MQARLLLPPKERCRFIWSTLKHLCREPRFRHQWRTADDLATLYHKWFTIPEPLQFNGNDLNNALLKDPALKLDIWADKSAPNHFSIYHDTYRPRHTNRETQCYYLCDPDGKESVKSPPVGKAWYDTFPELIGEIEALERASRNKEQRQFPTNVIELVSKASALIHERDNKLENMRSTKKRRLLHESDNSANSSNSQHGEGRSEESDGSDGSDKESNSRIDRNNGNDILTGG